MSWSHASYLISLLMEFKHRESLVLFWTCVYCVFIFSMSSAISVEIEFCVRPECQGWVLQCILYRRFVEAFSPGSLSHYLRSVKQSFTCDRSWESVIENVLWCGELGHGLSFSTVFQRLSARTVVSFNKVSYMHISSTVHQGFHVSFKSRTICLSMAISLSFKEC